MPQEDPLSIYLSRLSGGGAKEAAQQPSSNPVDAYLGRISGQPEQPPERSFAGGAYRNLKQVLFPLASSVVGFAQGGAELADKATLGMMPGYEGVAGWMEGERESLRQATPRAEDLGDVAWQVGGAMVGEAAPYMMVGAKRAQIAKGLGKAGMGKLGQWLRPAAKASGLGKKLGRSVGEATKEAAVVGPLDAAIAAQGPEYSMLANAAELLKEKHPQFSKFLEESSHSFLKRMASEVLLGGGADVALRGLGDIAGSGARRLTGGRAPERGAEAAAQAATEAAGPPSGPRGPRALPPGPYHMPSPADGPDYARYARDVAEQSRRERQAMIESGQYLPPRGPGAQQLPPQAGGPRLMGPAPSEPLVTPPPGRAGEAAAELPEEAARQVDEVHAELRNPSEPLTADKVDDLIERKDEALIQAARSQGTTPRSGQRALEEQVPEPVRQEALFGGPERPGAPEQTSFDVEPALGMTQEINNARSTVSALEGKIQRGQASEAERDMYMDALSVLRKNEGMSAEEVGLRATGAGEMDERVSELSLTSGYEKYKADYKDLTPEELVKRYGKLQRAVGATDTSALEMDRATVSYNTYGEPIAGTKEAGWKAQGRSTQMKQRLDALRSVMRERGIPEPDAPVYRDIGQSDVFDLDNKELVGRGGERIRAMSDEEIADHLRETMEHDYRESPKWSERITLLYDEATRSGRDVDLSMLGEEGFASIEATRALGEAAIGGAVGATAGAVAGGEHKKEGALVGLGFGGGYGAIRGVRRARKAALETRFPDDPAIQEVLNTIDTEGGNRVMKVLTEDVGGWRGLRQRVSKSHDAVELVTERLSGGSTKGRDLLSQARGYISSATQHLEDELAPVIKEVKEAGVGDVLALRKARRKLELMEQGYVDAAEKQIDITPEVARATIAKEGNIPEVARAADRLTEYYHNLLDKKRINGVITDEEYAAAIAKGEFYDPFVKADQSQPTFAGQPQKASRGAKVRRMTEKGSKSETTDAIDQAIMDTMETFSTIRRQNLSDYIGGLVRDHPEAAAELGIREVTESVARGEGGRPSLLPEQLNVIVGGERRIYDLSDNPLLFDAWASNDRAVNFFALEAANSTRKLFQHSITATPSFMIGNAMKDYFFSMVQTPLGGGARRLGAYSGAGAAYGALRDEDDRLGGAIKGAAAGALVPGAMHMARHATGVMVTLNDIVGPTLTGAILGGTAGGLSDDEGSNQFVRFLKGAAAGAGFGHVAGRLGLRGNKELYKEWMRQGGGQFGFYARNTSDAKQIRTMLERDGVRAEDVLSVRNGFEALQYLGRALETAPRFAHVKRALKDAGVDITDPAVFRDPKYADAWGEAVFRGRDLSIDFSVTGSSRTVQTAQKMVPFLRPGILGTDKFVRLLADPKTYPVAVATVIAPTVALYTLNADNENYHNQPDYVKRMYWSVPKPDGENFWKIPKPFELGAVASLVELTLDFMRNKDPEALKHSLKRIWTQMGPGAIIGASPVGLPLPGFMQGAIEAGFNYDMFRKRSIDPKPWANIDPSEQYDDRTSTLGYAIGQTLNLSPARVDHIISSIAPGMGEELNRLATRGLRLTGADPRGQPDVPWRGAFGRFHSSSTSISDPEQQFRRLHNEAERKWNTVKSFVDAGNMDKAEAYVAENREALERYQELDELKDVVDIAWDVRNYVYDSDLPMERKESILTTVNKNLARILKEARKEELEEDDDDEERDGQQ